MTTEKSTASQKVVDFTAPGTGGDFKLSAQKGHPVILYFYPKDNTPGCTTQGHDFTTLLPRLDELGADVLGVSRDSVKSHDNFRARQGYRFPLVSDPTEALCQAFGVIQEKNLYGRKVMGIVRSTFLIDPGSHIAAEWRGVKVPGHALAVLQALEAARPQ